MHHFLRGDPAFWISRVDRFAQICDTLEAMTPSFSSRPTGSLSPIRTLRLRRRLPVVLLAILLVNQVFNPARIWVGVMLALAVMLGMAYLWARQLRDHLHGTRSQRGTWILAGDLLSETFTVENHSSFPALAVEVVDHSDLPGYHPDWVATVDVRGSQSYPREGRCQRRGVFTLGPWELRSGDPLGIFSVRVEYPEARSILIYPRAMVLPDLQLPRGDAAGAARTHRPSRLYTTTVASVRPYVAGDPLRAIHWRQTAHHGEFMVKEFDLEPSGDLWIALDLDAAVQQGEGARSTLEYAITLTASLATEMLAENRRVGLVAQGHLIPPQPGQMQLWRILEVLARADPVSGAPAARLLDDLRPNVGRGRTVVGYHPLHRSGLDRPLAATGQPGQRAGSAAAGRAFVCGGRCDGWRQGGSHSNPARAAGGTWRAQPRHRQRLRVPPGAHDHPHAHGTAHAVSHGPGHPGRGERGSLDALCCGWRSGTIARHVSNRYGKRWQSGLEVFEGAILPGSVITGG